MRSGGGPASEGNRSAGWVGKNSLAETNATACSPAFNGLGKPSESGVAVLTPLTEYRAAAVNAWPMHSRFDLCFEGCFSGAVEFPWQQNAGAASAEPVARSGVWPREPHRASQVAAPMLATRKVSANRILATRLMCIVGLLLTAPGCSRRPSAWSGGGVFPDPVEKLIVPEQRVLRLEHKMVLIGKVQQA